MRRFSVILLVLVGTTLILTFGGCGTSKTVRYSGGLTESAQSMPHAASTHSGQLGNSKMYSYRYYPSSNVYYDPERNLFFYSNGEEWYGSNALPEEIDINQAEAVSMEMDTSTPYLAGQP